MEYELVSSPKFILTTKATDSVSNVKISIFKRNLYYFSRTTILERVRIVVFCNPGYKKTRTRKIVSVTKRNTILTEQHMDPIILNDEGYIFLECVRDILKQFQI